MHKIKNIKAESFPDEAFRDDYPDFIDDIMDRLVERLVWTLSLNGTARVGQIIDGATTFAESLRPHWKLDKSRSAPEEAPLSSLPDWTIDLFAQSYVGRQVAFLGAMEGDEASFAVLLLQSFFTIDALKTVCRNQPALAERYASRSLVWPWFVSAVKSYKDDLDGKLQQVGFASRTVKRHKMGTTLTRPGSAHVLGTMLWMRLVADSWDPDDAKQHPVLDVLRNMPDLGGRKLAAAKSIVHAAVEELFKRDYTLKLNLPYQGFGPRNRSGNKREIRKLVDQLIDTMLQPVTPSADVAAAPPASANESEKVKPKPTKKPQSETKPRAVHARKGG